MNQPEGEAVTCRSARSGDGERKSGARALFNFLFLCDILRKRIAVRNLRTTDIYIADVSGDFLICLVSLDVGCNALLVARFK